MKLTRQGNLNAYSLALLRLMGEEVLRTWRKVVGKVPFPKGRFGSFLAFNLALAHSDKLDLLMRNAGDEPNGHFLQKDLFETSIFAAGWMDWACPVLRPSAGLTAQLLLTDMGSVKMSEIQFPFDAFVIELPPDSPLTISGKLDDSKRFPARYICAHKLLFDAKPGSEIGKVRLDQSERLLQNFMFGHISKERLLEMIDSFRDMEIERNLWMQLISHNSSNWEEEANIYRAAPITETDTAEKMIVDLHGMEGDSVLPVTTKDDEVLDAALRLILNLCLYIGAGIEKLVPFKEKAFTKRQKRLAKQRTLYQLGTRVTLDSSMAKSAYDFAHKGVSPQWKISTRFTVRGHWKMQAYGPGRKERRRIFVEPYWKGPTMAEEVRRVYEVH